MVAKLVPLIAERVCGLALFTPLLVISDGASCMFPNTGSVRIRTCLSMKFVMSMSVALRLCLSCSSQAAERHLSRNLYGNFFMMVSMLAGMFNSCRYCTSSMTLQQPLRKRL